MKIRRRTARQGIALIIVMISIIVLSILAGGFAYAIKVETRLATRARKHSDLEWMGRSGMEFAKWVLAEQMRIANEPYDSLNQIWAGGPGTLNASNSPLVEISLTDVQLGGGHFSVKITDLERKANINAANEVILEKAMVEMGVEAGEISRVIAQLKDWMDPDDIENMQGAESSFYESQDVPYQAKNGPIDDISELLLIDAITPEMFRGGALPAPILDRKPVARSRFLDANEPPLYAFGLADVFTPISSGRININTAPMNTLLVLPFVDETLASEIIRIRSGPDGADGTEDDTPFMNAGELINAIPNPQIVGQLGQFVDVRSRTFEVTVDAVSGSARREFVGIIVRNSPMDLQLISFTAL